MPRIPSLSPHQPLHSLRTRRRSPPKQHLQRRIDNLAIALRESLQPDQSRLEPGDTFPAFVVLGLRLHPSLRFLQLNPDVCPSTAVYGFHERAGRLRHGASEENDVSICLRDDGGIRREAFGE